MLTKNRFGSKKKVRQNSKNERDGSRKTNESRQHRFGGFRITLSSFVLELDYADIAKRLRLVSQPRLTDRLFHHKHQSFRHRMP